VEFLDVFDEVGADDDVPNRFTSDETRYYQDLCINFCCWCALTSCEACLLFLYIFGENIADRASFMRCFNWDVSTHNSTMNDEAPYIFFRDQQHLPNYQTPSSSCARPSYIFRCDVLNNMCSEAQACEDARVNRLILACEKIEKSWEKTINSNDSRNPNTFWIANLQELLHDCGVESPPL